MRQALFRGCAALISASMLVTPGLAQTPQMPASATAAAAQGAEANAFNPEQLDALLAPIALYPDTLLVQVLMASTYPLQIVEAARWLASGDNKALKGDALAKALEPLPWDPSVKSLVPFPQVLEMMNQQLDWTQQLGYAVASQQEQVMDSVQRLRHQAQAAGTLKSTEQQVVSSQAVMDDQGQPTPQQTIVIQPANPQVVYVPTYNPSVAYGTWPYPATPPVYYPPPPGYAFGTALATGLAFGVGVAVVGSLWGWASPRWGYGGGCCGYGGGSINVNHNRYNNISVNNAHRGNFNGNNWRAPAQRPGVGGGARPPGGPVGRPARASGLPANAVGRPSVQVPASAVNRANIGGANRAGAAQGAGGVNRPGAGAGAGANRPGGTGIGQNNPGGVNRPGGVSPGGAANRPAGTTAAQRPAQQPAQRQASPQNQRQAPSQMQRQGGGGGAFGGVNQGARAGQFQQRGAQSRAMAAPRGGGGGGGGRGGGGGGGARRR